MSIRNMIEESVCELSYLISNMPPDSILNDYPYRNVWDQFLVNKRINVYVASRLYAKAQGNSPQIESEDIVDLVRSLAAYYQAQYNLIFECWDYLKPIAIIDEILTEDSQPRDAMKIILEDGFNKVFNKLSKDNRSLDKQARSIHDRANRDIKDNRNILLNKKLTNRDISMSESDWDVEFETLHPLLQLLMNVSTKHSKKSLVIATAVKHCRQTLIDHQREQVTYHRRLF